MKLVLCTVLDTVAGVYCRPFCARSEAEAQRIFSAMCEKDEQVSLAPSDYRLYTIGFFDEVSGELEGGKPSNLGAGSVPHVKGNGRQAGKLRRFLAGAR